MNHLAEPDISEIRCFNERLKEKITCSPVQVIMILINSQELKYVRWQ